MKQPFSKVWIITIIIVLIIGGILAWQYGKTQYGKTQYGKTIKETKEETKIDESKNKEEILAEKNEVKRVVEEFGKKLKDVIPKGTKESIKNSLEKNYSPYVSAELISKWVEDPLKIPGRKYSNVYPDRINVVEISKVDGEYKIRGEIVDVVLIRKKDELKDIRKRQVTLALKKTNPWKIIDVGFGPSGPIPIGEQAEEIDKVREVIENFGDKLKYVDKIAPEENIIKAIENYYSEYITPNLLSSWKSDPSKAPGKIMSSPYPDRIDIYDFYEPETEPGKYSVIALIVDRAGPDDAGLTPIKLIVKKINDKYLIDDLQIRGDYISIEPQTPFPPTAIASEKAKEFVEEFGKQLQKVNLSVPNVKIVSESMEQYYSGYVSQVLIKNWVKRWSQLNPIRQVPTCEIPGRWVSSPYPDRIEPLEVTNETMKGENIEKYRFRGWIVITYLGGRVAEREKFTAIIEKTKDKWLITEFDCGFTGPRG